MKLILNDLKYLLLSNIEVFKDRIYYNIGSIKINGIYLKSNKYMIKNKTNYIVRLDEKMNLLNKFFNKEYRQFLRYNNYPYIEVIRNDKTEEIFNDNEEFIILNFMSINNNYYPKIHILPWKT